MTLATGLRSALLGRRDVSRDEISAAEQRFAGTLFIYPEGRAPRRAQRVDCWSVLYLELGGEGPDGCVGTRVEIPTPVFHDYFGVDYTIVFDVLQNKIPPLRQAVEEILRSEL